MVPIKKLARLRTVITENLRVQRDGETIDYINIGHALQDVCAKQNHTIFARRGCGKTLLLHHSSRTLPKNARAVYLNCEDFKRHSFPNVLIEILIALFGELERNLTGWFGKKKKSKLIIQEIIKKLSALQKDADIQDEDIKKKVGVQAGQQMDASWPAPGSEDTELGVLMEPEVRHGASEVYAGVQA
jgi:ABC-type cobalamin/Fe3+-siderophores transport system ATPase subunit